VSQWAVKFVVVLYKRPDFTESEFRDFLRQVHGPMAQRLPGLKKYVQNYPADDDHRRPPQWSAIVELYWNDREAMEAAWASPEGQRATADLEAFADLSKTSWSIVDAVEPQLPTSDPSVAGGASNSGSGMVD
jgi:uncharacterized protein (TIGR02118 family)